jgi:endoglucanase
MKRVSAFAAVLLAAAAVSAAEMATSRPLVSDCSAPFKFGFLGWEKAPAAFKVEAGGLHIAARECKGGAGLMAGGSISLAGHGDWTPAIRVAATPQNQAAAITLHLGDGDGTGHQYRFDLRKLKPGEVAVLVAEHGASLDAPEKVEKAGTAPGLDLETITNVMIIGEFSAKPIDIFLSGITLVPPDEQLKAERVKLAKTKADAAAKALRDAQAKAKARQDLLEKGSPHPADGPEVRHVCAVAPDVLAITLQAGQHVGNQLIPYVAQSADEIVEEEKDKFHHEVVDGRIVQVLPKTVFRKDGKKRERLGTLSPDGKLVFIAARSKGQALDETVVDLPEAYSIQSADDSAYSRPLQPVKVYRKGKPDGYSQPLPFLYTVSLRLPSPLKEGATYSIGFRCVNTAKEAILYTHKPRAVRSIAVHAIQTGYRPDDPYKRAYLSFWMGVDQDGKSGSCAPDVESFDLLDSAGKTVFSGKAELAKADDAEEQISIHEKVDYTKAAVRRLDFSAFSAPGEYCVLVPGVGVSSPFRIAADVWGKPFQAAMQGILTQRQGIELGPPACLYKRPRTFHPDDGVQFYQMTIPVQGGQEAGEGGNAGRGGNLLELARAGPLERVTGVWGGYQDAGDWDTLSHHLSATYDLLGLYDLNPAAFSKIKLSLPSGEMSNSLPDILDEAMWQMPCWRRLQLPDGGVRGGYGYGWGCPAGMTSSMIRSAGVYAADPVSTYHYAGVAARAARVLAALNQSSATEYLESAKRAWAWAEAHCKEDDAVYQRTLAFAKDLKKNLRNFRAEAAVELLAVTRDPAFAAAFRESSELAGPPALYLEQISADFACARLPDGLGEAALKQEAVKRIVAYADHAIEFSHKNAFDIITGHRTDMPMIFVSRYFSTPAAGGMALIYAYELTRKPQYLTAAVQGSNYCLGANPDNLSYCTGVGCNAQHFNFIVDAQNTGQLPDIIVGHIPYGQGNEGSAMSRGANAWVQQWLLNFGPAKKMVPNWFDWPVNEQYIDFAHYPLHNENCFNQTTVPAACYWFYLATR